MLLQSRETDICRCDRILFWYVSPYLHCPSRGVPCLPQSWCYCDVLSTQIRQPLCVFFGSHKNSAQASRYEFISPSVWYYRCCARQTPHIGKAFWIWRISHPAPLRSGRWCFESDTWRYQNDFVLIIKFVFIWRVLMQFSVGSYFMYSTTRFMILLIFNRMSPLPALRVQVYYYDFLLITINLIVK